MILLLAVSACRIGPTHHPAQCDFLTAPEKYEGQTIEVSGNIFQAADGSYRFETYCNPPDRPYMEAKLISMRLVWRGGEKWPEGILRAPRRGISVADLSMTSGRLIGRLQRIRQQWVISADEFGPVRYEL